jgi:hypothetical protein
MMLTSKLHDFTQPMALRAGAALEDKGWNLKDLAIAAGLPPDTVYGMMRFRIPGSMNAWCAVFNALGAADPYALPSGVVAPALPPTGDTDDGSLPVLDRRLAELKESNKHAVPTGYLTKAHVDSNHTLDPTVSTEEAQERDCGTRTLAQRLDDINGRLDKLEELVPIVKRLQTHTHPARTGMPDGPL